MKALPAFFRAINRKAQANKNLRVRAKQGAKSMIPVFCCSHHPPQTHHLMFAQPPVVENFPDAFCSAQGFPNVANDYNHGQASGLPSCGNACRVYTTPNEA